MSIEAHVRKADRRFSTYVIYRPHIARYTNGIADALYGLRDTAVTLTDATIALLLAAKIHGTDKAVRATAKRCAQALPRSQRDLMFSIVNSKEPLKHIAHIAESLDLD